MLALVTPISQTLNNKQAPKRLRASSVWPFSTPGISSPPPSVLSVCRTSHRPPTRERGRAYERPTRHRPGCGRTWRRSRRRPWSCRRWSGRKPVPPFPSWARRSWTCRQKCDHHPPTPPPPPTPNPAHVLSPPPRPDPLAVPGSSP